MNVFSFNKQIQRIWLFLLIPDTRVALLCFNQRLDWIVACAMFAARAMLLYRVAVCLRPVSFVDVNAILRVFLAQFDHHAIANYFASPLTMASPRHAVRCFGTLFPSIKATCRFSALDAFRTCSMHSTMASWFAWYTPTRSTSSRSVT